MTILENSRRLRIHDHCQFTNPVNSGPLQNHVTTLVNSQLLRLHDYCQFTTLGFYDPRKLTRIISRKGRKATKIARIFAQGIISKNKNLRLERSKFTEVVNYQKMDDPCQIHDTHEFTTLTYTRLLRLHDLQIHDRLRLHDDSFEFKNLRPLRIHGPCDFMTLTNVHDPLLLHDDSCYSRLWWFHDPYELLTIGNSRPWEFTTRANSRPLPGWQSLRITDPWEFTTLTNLRL